MKCIFIFISSSNAAKKMDNLNTYRFGGKLSSMGLALSTHILEFTNRVLFYTTLQNNVLGTESNLSGNFLFLKEGA